MVSSLIRNQVPGNRLRVRPPCPPLDVNALQKRACDDIPSPALSRFWGENRRLLPKLLLFCASARTRHGRLTASSLNG